MQSTFRSSQKCGALKFVTVSRGFIKIGGILRVLRIILRLNVDEVWVFFIQTNQTWIRYFPKKYSQK